MPDPTLPLAGSRRTGSPRVRPSVTAVKPLPDRWFIDHGTNAEMRWDAVEASEFDTPTDRFFIRSHTGTPEIDLASYRLQVYGDGLAGSPGRGQAVPFTYDELTALPARTVTEVLECAGNGRRYFQSQQGMDVPGTEWALGGVGQATWRGVPLAEILERAGLLDSAREVMAVGMDAPYVRDGIEAGPVRRPLPIEKALDDVLVVFEMNGRTLPADHGFPVRLLVPGWVGVASIKWLGELEVSRAPLTSPWSTIWYRMSGGDHPLDSPPLTLQPVRSAFELGWGAAVPARRGVVLHGRSWSGSGAIRRVEVSCDGGRRWEPARLVDAPAAGEWTRWRLTWTPPEPGEYELLARATDDVGRAQPDTVPFNTEGYLFCGVVRHPVVAVG